jgi:hypothetical protein
LGLPSKNLPANSRHFAYSIANGRKFEPFQVRFVSKVTVLPIFWTLAIVGPMSEKGGGASPAKKSYLGSTERQRANKELDMKRPFFSLLAVMFLIGLTGCISHHLRRPVACSEGDCGVASADCQNCESSADPGGGIFNCRRCPQTNAKFFNPGRLCKGGRYAEGEAAEAGPATGAVTYPYYTTRGPRDFLAKNPPSIGPN